MKFGEALTLLNAGHPMTREGWNGRGMFIIRAGGYSVPAQDTRPNSFVNEAFLKNRGLTQLEILPHIDMWTAQNTYIAGWVASQSDMMADDWQIHVEEENHWGKAKAEVVAEVQRQFNNELRKLVKKPHWTQTPEGKKKMAARKRRGKK